MKKSKSFQLITTLAIIFLSFTVLARPAEEHTGMIKQLSAWEKSANGRIGLVAINTSNNEKIEYRANESFPMGCTAKVIGVTAILKLSMQDAQLLQSRIIYYKNNLVTWSPITENHIRDGMTIAELCAAAISYSDNTAMNLLAKKLAGPAGLNKFARSIGDSHFKLDHWWPEEALSSPLSLKDSSTPNAMNNSLYKIVFEKVLRNSEREKLISWMKANTTGDHRIRAGVPANWSVADKTGTGNYGVTNDIAVIWPPHCLPIILTIFYSSDSMDAPHREDILASATSRVINEFAKKDRCISHLLATSR